MDFRRTLGRDRTLARFGIEKPWRLASTKEQVTIWLRSGTPSILNAKGDSAHVVLPATMAFKLRGKKVTQSGATWTVALRKLPEGWRIAAWAWAKGKPQQQ